MNVLILSIYNTHTVSNTHTHTPLIHFFNIDLLDLTSMQKLFSITCIIIFCFSIIPNVKSFPPDSLKVAATSLKLEIRLHAHWVGANTQSDTEVMFMLIWLAQSLVLGYFAQSYFRLKQWHSNFKLIVLSIKSEIILQYTESSLVPNAWANQMSVKKFTSVPDRVFMPT